MPRSISLPMALCSILFAALTVAVGCERGVERAEFRLDFEKYTLANGLKVILHEDKSDPVVSVSVCYHVGSYREALG